MAPIPSFSQVCCCVCFYFNCSFIFSKCHLYILGIWEWQMIIYFSSQFYALKKLHPNLTEKTPHDLDWNWMLLLEVTALYYLRKNRCSVFENKNGTEICLSPWWTVSWLYTSYSLCTGSYFARSQLWSSNTFSHVLGGSLNLVLVNEI